MKQLTRGLLRYAFSLKKVRNRLVFEVSNYYYADLNIVIPIGDGLVCPIIGQDYYSSFNEVFFSEEYIPIFDRIPIPSRWLDLGCHAGFFSLLMAKRNLQQDNHEFQALLIDADSRVALSIQRIGALNGLTEQLTFCQGAIASRPGVLEFAEREVMASSDVTLGPGTGTVKKVSVLRPEDIAQLLPPPYDLIKVDIEGTEYEFLTTYGNTLQQTRYLLLEWHSWHHGGNGKQGIIRAAEEAGFHILMDVVEGNSVNDGLEISYGVLLFENNIREEFFNKNIKN